MNWAQLLIGLTLLGAATVYVITRNPNADGHLEHYAFQKFKRNFGVTYKNQGEESYRLSVFLENLKSIEANNANPLSTHVEEVNSFTDLTEEEFAARYLMKDLPQQMNKDLPILEMETLAAPQVIDWTAKNVLPPVKNQQQCGSCWAFSTAGMLEGVYNIHESPQTPISFSEQQLVDCCGAQGFGCEGCNGAWPTDAVAYTQKFGIVQESQYAYTAKDGSCKTALQGTGYKPSAQFQVAATDAALQAALQVQPISICVDASKWSSYSKGIFSNCSAKPSAADHAVLLVGLNADNTWKVRNSWGTSWGQSGYITLAAGNTCGLENYAIYATY